MIRFVKILNLKLSTVPIFTVDNENRNPYNTPLVNTNSAVAMKNTCSNMGAKFAKVRKMLCDPCSDMT